MTTVHVPSHSRAGVHVIAYSRRGGLAATQSAELRAKFERKRQRSLAWRNRLARMRQALRDGPSAPLMWSWRLSDDAPDAELAEFAAETPPMRMDRRPVAQHPMSRDSAAPRAALRGKFSRANTPVYRLNEHPRKGAPERLWLPWSRAAGSTIPPEGPQTPVALPQPRVGARECVLPGCRARFNPKGRQTYCTAAHRMKARALDKQAQRSDAAGIPSEFAWTGLRYQEAYHQHAGHSADVDGFRPVDIVDDNWSRKASKASEPGMRSERGINVGETGMVGTNGQLIERYSTPMDRHSWRVADDKEHGRSHHEIDQEVIDIRANRQSDEYPRTGRLWKWWTRVNSDVTHTEDRG